VSVAPGNVNVAEFPYGNPGSVGEPLGMWFGEQDITGDATGGTVIGSFMVQNLIDNPTLIDHRNRYVYFVDALDAVVTADGGFWSTQVFTHNARANVAIATRHRHVAAGDLVNNGSVFVPDQKMWGPDLRQEPFFWEPQELIGAFNTWIQFQFSTNVNAATYALRCKGRYYDRAILTQRGLARLIQPAAVTQFQG